MKIKEIGGQKRKGMVQVVEVCGKSTEFILTLFSGCSSCWPFLCNWVIDSLRGGTMPGTSACPVAFLCHWHRANGQCACLMGWVEGTWTQKEVRAALVLEALPGVKVGGPEEMGTPLGDIAILADHLALASQGRCGSKAIWWKDPDVLPSSQPPPCRVSASKEPKGAGYSLILFLLILWARTPGLINMKENGNLQSFSSSLRTLPGYLPEDTVSSLQGAFSTQHIFFCD